MSTAGDTIGYLAQAGLDTPDIWKTVAYLQTGQVPDNLSDRAWQAIQRLGGAGLDEHGVNRAISYLRTGQDPEGDQERAAQAAAVANEQAPPAPVAPPKVLAEDPAYLAYQRALGAEDAADTEATTSRQDTLRRAVGDQIAQLTGQGEQQRRGISGSLEARGLFRSGEHEKALADQRQNEGQQAAVIQSTSAQQLSDLTQQLAQRRAARQRAGAEQGLNTANNLYVS